MCVYKLILYLINYRNYTYTHRYIFIRRNELVNPDLITLVIEMYLITHRTINAIITHRAINYAFFIRIQFLTHCHERDFFQPNEGFINNFASAFRN